jgi:hypothetical protein
VNPTVANREHPTTSADVHLLVSADQLPDVEATASLIGGAETVFARLLVDDMPKLGPRHRVSVSVSGQRKLLLHLLDQLRSAVANVPVPIAGEPEQR